MSVLTHRTQDRFSDVTRAWAGGAAVVIAGGPSLTPGQIERVREAHAAGRVHVIAVNDAYRLAPFAEILYFADSHWWGWHKDRVEFIAYAGQKCTIQNSGANVADLTVHMLKNGRHPHIGYGLSLRPGELIGRDGGFQALNLAIQAGAKTVILLGFDGRPNAEGKTHWFGEHPRPTPAAAYEQYRRGFSVAENDIAAAGVRVLNCSPGTGIDSFPKVALEEALA